MDEKALQILARLIHGQRIAALGTLRGGAPHVSMVLYAPEADFSGFWLHLSRLAFHAQNLLRDPRISLMIAERDTGEGDPQTLARVSIQGEAVVVPRTSEGFAAAQALYLARFPESASQFALGDFEFYCLRPQSARFVAGFGMIFNLSTGDFQQAASII